MLRHFYESQENFLNEILSLVIIAAESVRERKKRLLMFFDDDFKGAQIAVFVSQHQDFIRRGLVHTLSLISNAGLCQKICNARVPGAQGRVTQMLQSNCNQHGIVQLELVFQTAERILLAGLAGDQEKIGDFARIFLRDFGPW